MDTKNGEILKELQEESPISAKRQINFCLKLRKRKYKTKKFSKIVHAEETYLPLNRLNISENTSIYTQILLLNKLYLTVFNKKQTKTIKLLNEEARMLQKKTLNLS